MKKLIFSLLAIVQFSGSIMAQQSFKDDRITQTEPKSINLKDIPTLPPAREVSGSPYRTKFAIDGPAAIVGVGVNALGLYLIQENKHGVSDEELKAIDSDIEAAKNKINSFDRFSAGWYSLDAKKASDYPFYGSFAAPLLLLFDKDISKKAGQVGVIYVETMALTGALFTMSVAHVERNRPLVYDEDAKNDPDHERNKKHAQNSFFAGHTAAAASATFFAAKVFHDFNPDSGMRPVVWGVAAAVPAAVGYLRLKAGKHFLSDNILGYFIGAGSGILVPQLHKSGLMDGVSIVPVAGPYNGLAATITF